MRSPNILLLALLGASIATVRADDFERLEGRTLSQLPGSDKTEARERLSIADLGTLPNILGTSGATPLIVETSEGNPSKLLVAPAFRKAPGSDPDDEPDPVFILERFATFEGAAARDRIAQGRGIFLFDGFSFDLDSGQVVPEGQGGDIRFLIDQDGPRLEPVNRAKLFIITQAPEFEGPGARQPSPGRNVLPGDFAGRYLLYADGSLSGTLVLEIKEQTVSGQFRSDQSGTAYRVAGEIENDRPRRIRFTIEFPRTRQFYEGFLFAEGKGAMAGNMLMQETEVGFFALREGGMFAPGEGQAKADRDPDKVQDQEVKAQVP